jgi:hypothetical protein
MPAACFRFDQSSVADCFASIATPAKFACSASSTSADCIRFVTFTFLTPIIGFDCMFCSSFLQTHSRVVGCSSLTDLLGCLGL